MINYYRLPVRVVLPDFDCWTWREFSRCTATEAQHFVVAMLEVQPVLTFLGQQIRTACGRASEKPTTSCEAAFADETLARTGNPLVPLATVLAHIHPFCCGALNYELLHPVDVCGEALHFLLLAF